ncbi:P27 family phage terminase small subunit [Naumannella halotolerans]|uniref:P27 family phage terminase small subunit n=1 Tax=Naumannella halotolerans TaxID=993414 RepID=UPI0014152B89|nr:P27 family phage terminase small subunit [Naumannella halotolerans]
MGSAAADVPPTAPVKPEDVEIDPGLSELWDEVVPELDKAGLVTSSDGPAIEMCLRHMIMARRAFRQVDDVMVDDPAHGGQKKHPAEAVFRLESAAFLEYAKQLGMTFMSRARTPSQRGDADGENPFASAAGG